MRLKKLLIAGGNSTLLVWDCPLSQRKKVIEKSLDEVEQVGFVSKRKGLPQLTMMGGEFCVNATLALASQLGISGKFFTSGLRQPVKYHNVQEKTSVQFSLPYKKIDNMVLFPGIGFLCVKKKIKLDKPTLASLAAKYHLPAFGIIFYEGSTISPYVYVVKTNSLVCETACGSGSIAMSLITRKKRIIQPTGKILSVQKTNGKVTVSASVTPC